MDSNSSDSLTVGTPVCEHNNRFVRESRPRLDGLVRRRWQCNDCGERWTTIGPDRKPPRKRKPGRLAPKKLTREQVKRALTDRQISDVKLARELGVSRQAISQVRRGISWARAFPKLKRRPWKDCSECRHWCGGSCGLGFPDPLEEGTSFAGDCDLYEV
jgi:transposase-like protein